MACTMATDRGNRVWSRLARIRGAPGNAAPPFQRISADSDWMIGGSRSRAPRANRGGGIDSHHPRARKNPRTRSRSSQYRFRGSHTRGGEAVDGADLVPYVLPGGACGSVAEEIAPHLKARARSSTTVGSQWARLVRDRRPICLPRHFRAGHPVAGTEHSARITVLTAVINRWCFDSDRTAAEAIF